MNFTTPTQIRTELQALVACKDEMEAWGLFVNPRKCAIGTYNRIIEKREPGMSVQEAAKKALEGM